MTALLARLTKLETLARNRQRAESSALTAIRRDRANLFRLAGMTPDPWQEQQLRSTAQRVLLLCSRQAGKSTTAAALALGEALLTPRATVLLLSPSQRQSGELFKKVTDQYGALGRPVPVRSETATQLQLANGSRVVSLPGTEQTVRGYSGVRLLVIDEASRVPDALYASVRPMLATSRGRLVVLSTPFGQRGFFFQEWEDGGPDWDRVKITATDCPRIPPQFLEEERHSLGERWWRQEYFCSFEDAVDAVFAQGDIMAALRSDVQPLFGL